MDDRRNSAIHKRLHWADKKLQRRLHIGLQRGQIARSTSGKLFSWVEKAWLYLLIEINVAKRWGVAIFNRVKAFGIAQFEFEILNLIYKVKFKSLWRGPKRNLLLIYFKNADGQIVERFGIDFQWKNLGEKITGS